MRFVPARIPDVVVVEPEIIRDERGFFAETWRRDRFAEAGIDVGFVQENQSGSIRNTLRGLHYQLRQPQGKLTRVVVGETFAVAVDLRRSSSTFAEWVGFALSAENARQLWIPPGFAHGFLALSDVTRFVYRCTDYYAPQHERAIRWDDPGLGIDWPLPTGVEPLLSERDRAAPPLSVSECYP